MSLDVNISMSVIKRLPRYYRFLGKLKNEGYVRISSRELSELMSVTASQIRQDLNCFGGFGHQGYGYNVEQLHNEIGKILGVNKKIDAILIGVGNLGRAIASHMDFEARGFRLIGIFDRNEALFDQEIRNVKIRSTVEIRNFCKKNHPQVAIICTPTDATEKIIDELVSQGVAGFWNYSHFDISSKYSNVEVQNVHLSDSLLTLGYQIKSNKELNKMRHGCCMPGGSFMPQGVGEISRSSYDILKDGCDIIKESGYDFSEATVGLIMGMTDDEFKKALNTKMNLEICNSFIPPYLKIVENPPELMVYVEKALSRASALGAKYIIFGSGQARMIPDDMDYNEGMRRIEDFLVRCDKVCSKYGIQIAIEPLNSKEANTFITVSDTLKTLEKLQLENIKVLADAYHMYTEKEDIDILEKALPYLVHVHISEPYERTYPGQRDGIYLEKFAEKLKEIGYHATVTVECGFGDFEKECKLAYDFVSKTF